MRAMGVFLDRFDDPNHKKGRPCAKRCGAEYRVRPLARAIEVEDSPQSLRVFPHTSTAATGKEPPFAMSPRVRQLLWIDARVRVRGPGIPHCRSTRSRTMTCFGCT